MLVLVLGLAFIQVASVDRRPTVPVPVPRATVVPPAQHAQVTPTPVGVEVRAEGVLLWQGTLNVGAQPSSYRENRTEAPSPPCVAHPYGSSRGTGLSVTLSRFGYPRDEAGRLRVSIEWSRADDDACPAADLLRKAVVEGTVDLPTAGTVRVRGDAGLEVRLTRR